MQGYNDYYRLTEGYLRNYTQLQAALTNMRNVREMKYAEVNECRVPIANYSAERIAGGELTPTEATAERMIELKKEITRLDYEIVELNTKLKQVTIALDALDDASKKIIDMRYITGMSWKSIEQKTGYSERHCRRLAAKGVWEVCRMLFKYRIRDGWKYQFVS